jgi:5-methyltetrahydropteroyltriglutamate--homocysteine methyltransferase
MLFPTSLVGSYPQPDWLIDRKRLADRFPPRVRARELWRVDPEYLEQAQLDATLLAIRVQEEAGLDIIGPIHRRRPVLTGDLAYLRARTNRTVKMTVPGPFTMAQQAQIDYYPDREAAAFGYAEAVNEEVKDLFAAGADIVQLDEPYLQARPEEARKYGVPVLNRALDGAGGTTAVHLCFGYAAIIHDRPEGYSFLPELAASEADQVSIETAQSRLDCSVLAALDSKTIILGVLDLNDYTVETPDQVTERVRRALPYVPAERVVLAPDCGMKYLPRAVAAGKLAAMTEAATRLRAELG